MLLINSEVEQWIAPALFLAWDRHILNGGLDDKMSLMDLITSEEFYKLLGVTQEFVTMRANRLVDLYINVGRLARLLSAKKLPSVEAGKDAAILDAREPPEVPEEEGLEWLEQQVSDEAVERQPVERQEQKRNRKKAAALKKHYDNTCMFCGARPQVSEDTFYSEAAHIRGLGELHNGPDKASNMIVLCPNHHPQFDQGMLRLYKDGARYRIISKIVGGPLHGKEIALAHSVDDYCIECHYNWLK